MCLVGAEGSMGRMASAWRCECAAGEERGTFGVVYLGRLGKRTGTLEPLIKYILASLLSASNGNVGFPNIRFRRNDVLCQAKIIAPSLSYSLHHRGVELFGAAQ